MDENIFSSKKLLLVKSMSYFKIEKCGNCGTLMEIYKSINMGNDDILYRCHKCCHQFLRSWQDSITENRKPKDL